MKDALVVVKEFFDLPVEEKERFYSEDPNWISCVVKTSIDFRKEKFHFWRDTLRHRTHPLEDHIHHWPENPARYRYILLQLLLSKLMMSVTENRLGHRTRFLLKEYVVRGKGRHGPHC